MRVLVSKCMDGKDSFSIHEVVNSILPLEQQLEGEDFIKFKAPKITPEQFSELAKSLNARFPNRVTLDRKSREKTFTVYLRPGHLTRVK